jgi:uncharacterized membrane protein YfcA
MDFTLINITLIGLIFIWIGFVRSGLGFGGAALGLPLLLFVYASPIYWLPIIGLHLLIFSSFTLFSRIGMIDWENIKKGFIWILPAFFLGIFGLIKLPDFWVMTMIYIVTLIYALVWLGKFSRENKTKSWMDKVLLVFGGYVAGIALSGSPLIAGVFAKNVEKEKLRNTLFVLWFVLVSAKMISFLFVGVPINLEISLYLVFPAIIGHFIGLKFHQEIIKKDGIYKFWVGGALAIVSLLGLGKIFLS